MGDGSSNNNNKNNNDGDREELLPWVDTLGISAANKQSCLDLFQEKQEGGPTTTTTTPLLRQKPFSILSWNILAQSLYESNHRTKKIKQVALFSLLSNSNTQQQQPQLPPPTTILHPWSKRLHHIIQTLSHSNADIICLQECELHSFTHDLIPHMTKLGYDGIAQEDVRENKPAQLKEVSKHRDPRNHIGATFWKQNKFELVGDVDVSVRTRSLTTILRVKDDDNDCSSGNSSSNSRKVAIGEKSRNQNDKMTTTTIMPTVAIVNCHLEGHPKRFLERTLQLQHALSDLSKMIIQQQQQQQQQQQEHETTTKEKSTRSGGGSSSSSKLVLNALILAGDFNCELQSSACSTYLRMGRLGRQAGLGGIHGEDALVLPPSLLESNEAAEILHPIIEWGRALPDEKVGDISPHPFRRNGMTSAYPTWLGKDDATRHFTYCGEENKRPVPGLDQIWYSSMTIERVGLKRMFVNSSGEWRCISDDNVLSQLRDYERRKVLSTGLPSPDGQYPSDHLPIGAVFDWKVNNNNVASSSVAKQPPHRDHDDSTDYLRRLQIIDEEGNNVEEALTQDEATTALEEQHSFETPNHELEFLMTNCPFDSLEQKSDVMFLLQPIHPPIDTTTRAKPTKEQLEQLDTKREKKAELLKSASLGVRPWLKKIWKVEKQVGKWERRQMMMTRKEEEESHA